MFSEYCYNERLQGYHISPYLENELWEKEDLLAIIKYDINERNKTIISLL